MASSDAPSTKKARLDNGDSYIPTEDGGGHGSSILFSLKEEKGALARSLKPFEVRPKSEYASV